MIKIAEVVETAPLFEKRELDPTIDKKEDVPEAERKETKIVDKYDGRICRYCHCLDACRKDRQNGKIVEYYGRRNNCVTYDSMEEYEKAKIEFKEMYGR